MTQQPFKQCVLYREMANNQTLELILSYGDNPKLDLIFIAGLEAFLRRLKKRMKDARHPQPPEADSSREQDPR